MAAGLGGRNISYRTLITIDRPFSGTRQPAVLSSRGDWPGAHDRQPRWYDGMMMSPRQKLAAKRCRRGSFSTSSVSIASARERDMSSAVRRGKGCTQASVDRVSSWEIRSHVGCASAARGIRDGCVYVLAHLFPSRRMMDAHPDPISLDTPPVQRSPKSLLAPCPERTAVPSFLANHAGPRIVPAMGCFDDAHRCQVLPTRPLARRPLVSSARSYVVRMLRAAPRITGKRLGIRAAPLPNLICAPLPKYLPPLLGQTSVGIGVMDYMDDIPSSRPPWLAHLCAWESPQV